ncbi:hypothetical protein DLR41_25265 [Salmonella enterica subsp. enterica serovar Panama]|nr:hypothetical protein [Salmonella enterica subsp. enterica serovar Panama]EBV0538414.1 hypothetical protein [Salmonella enterica subsp. enterica serovar Glostrup]ECU9998068.1 hypothetical protein [Salmonella enterica subsp. diarizonae serovar 48:i:z]EDO3655438.1 hypothetical protein [Salmonella enterica]
MLVNVSDFFTVLACGIGGALAGHFIVNLFTWYLFGFRDYFTRWVLNGFRRLIGVKPDMRIWKDEKC